MKKYLFCFVVVAFFFGCSSDSDNTSVKTPPTVKEALSEEEKAWLKGMIYPLSTCEPNDISTGNDLKILDDLVGDATIVALGEVTHGSSEIFKMKHRIVQYLAEYHQFDIFSIEANMPESYEMNNYVLHGIGNPTKILEGMYFWTWYTQEVLNMAKWMYKYNTTSNTPIQFTGFDMQFHQGAIQNLKNAFEEKPEVIKVIEALNSELSLLDRSDDGTFELSTEKKGELNKMIANLHNAISELEIDDRPREWLYRNTRVIEQMLEISYENRDRSMAENILWIKSQNPDSKMAVWAHNGHIQKGTPLSYTPMGMRLKEKLKDDYLTIGFAFHQGSYTAVGNAGLKGYTAQKSYSGTFEYAFESINEPIFLIDLRKVKEDTSINSQWLREKLKFRMTGAMHLENEFATFDLIENFDILIFIKNSTSSKLLY